MEIAVNYQPISSLPLDNFPKTLQNDKLEFCLELELAEMNLESERPFEIFS